MTSPTPTPHRGLGLGFAALAVATYGLIVLGALVRANGAGLACPDWPLCFGAVVPQLDLRVGFEFGHRALAGGITLALAGLTLAVRRSDLDAGAPLLLAWLLLAVQVVLGGLTVLLRLAPWTVTAHLLTGTAFCATLVWLGSRLLEGPVERSAVGRGTALLVGLVALLVPLQIGLGGVVSSHAAGLACAHFPTCDGAAYAPTLQGMVGLHVLHRLNGYTLGGVVFALALVTRGPGRLGVLSRVALHLVVLQIAVGALNVLLRLPVEITGLHSALAAAIALVSVLLVREVWLARPALQPQAGHAQSGGAPSGGALEAG